MTHHDPRHWWNGRWGRLGRRDVYLRAELDTWVVEARSGGADGTTRTWNPPTEQDALLLVEDLLSDQDGWRELTFGALRPDSGKSDHA